MVQNDIPSNFSTLRRLTPEAIVGIVSEISNETGFVSSQEMVRRTIYTPDKIRRLRFRGTYQGKDVTLCFQISKPEIEEESIREQFRAAAKGLRIRPPHTYASRPFDESRGYAWSIDEYVNSRPLFEPSKRPEPASHAFMVFYEELHRVMSQPFWPCPDADAYTFSVQQLEKWVKIALDIDPERVARLEPQLQILADEIGKGMRNQSLSFVHPHLAGHDVQVTRRGYVVFANEYWSWRQPGYSLAFPIWGQWMALDPARRKHEHVQHITDTWLTAIKEELIPTGIVELDAVKTMLLNRIYGALILDIPAQRNRYPEDAIRALEHALLDEADRLMDM